ncbi:MAG: hypothetical protein O6947_01065, partial [Acidobacteria bacterium]|nr:hypothetical protein [Acidobacteriota bacterium]
MLIQEPRPRQPEVAVGEGAGQKSIRRKGAAPARGLDFPRRFTIADVDPFEELVWETRTASITNEKGETVFEQKDVEIPSTWSQMATNVV